MLFLFGMMGILATRYAGTTIAPRGQADRFHDRPTVDSRTEIIGRQPSCQTVFGRILPSLTVNRSGSAANRRMRSPAGEMAHPAAARIGQDHNLSALFVRWQRAGADRVGAIFFRLTFEDFVSNHGSTRNLCVAPSYALRMATTRFRTGKPGQIATRACPPE